MSLRPLLERLAAGVPGLLGAIVVDWEGEAVEQVGRLDEYELKIIGAHKGVILRNMRDVVSRLGDDQVREIVITTARARILVLPITSEYYMVMTLDRVDLLGRALFEARRCVVSLQKEIS